jgi:hypothetical protein
MLLIWRIFIEKNLKLVSFVLSYPFNINHKKLEII